MSVPDIIILAGFIVLACFAFYILWLMVQSS